MIEMSKLPHCVKRPFYTRCF